MSKGQISLIGLVVCLALFFALNVLGASTLRSARIDLTENKLYTLSEGTKNILADLDQDIHLYLFWSKGLAEENKINLSDYANRVEELLEEFETHAGGRVKLEVIEPEPFSEEEDRAVGFGLRGIPAGGDLAYFGLAATNETDDEEVIPFLLPQREEFLEYDLAKIVSTLATNEKPLVGLMTDLPLRGRFNPQNPQQAPQPWFVLESIEGTFEVRTVATDVAEIPEDITILMVVHPKNFSDKARYAIDQFVLRGGKLLCFVDPHCEFEAPPPDPQNPMQALQAEVSSDLEDLFAAWGIELLDGKIAGDQESASIVGFGGQQIEYLAWLSMDPDRFEEEDPITADLKSLVIPTAGVLKKMEGTSMSVAPLIQTSKDAATIERTSIAFGPDPEGLLKNFFPGDQELMIACRISGQARSAFPDGKPTEVAEDGEEPAPLDPGANHLAKSDGPINVVVVADVDMLYDRWWVRIQNLLGTRLAMPQADNGNLVVNALDNLSGSNDLISLRSRGRFRRPFERVTEIRREADERFRAKEDELEQKLQETERKLNDLQRAREDGQREILTPEQRAQIDEFRAERVKTRKELREVRLQQNQDIERLGTLLYLGNTFGIGLLIVVLAVAQVFFGRSKKRSSR